jgi:hypothetical protein
MFEIVDHTWRINHENIYDPFRSCWWKPGVNTEFLVKFLADGIHCCGFVVRPVLPSPWFEKGRRSILQMLVDKLYRRLPTA